MTIQVRRQQHDYGQPIARYWNDQSPCKTHLLNGFNLFFPAAEKYMIAIMTAALRRIETPELESQMRAFIGQEAQHAAQHERFFTVLRAQGYRIDGCVRANSAIFNLFVRRASLPLCLAVASAGEHFTAVAAEHALRHDMFAAVDVPLKPLFEWHSAEELEHKTVMYDVSSALGHNSYPLRVLGLVLGGLIFFACVLWGTAILLAQDGQLWSRRAYRDSKSYAWDKKLLHALGRATLAYLRRDFHPGQHDTEALVSSTLRSLSLEPAERAADRGSPPSTTYVPARDSSQKRTSHEQE